MPEEKEIPEFYSDQFMISGGPYGVVVNFRASPPEPGPGKVPDTVARVRMSYELVKTLTFVLCRHIKKIERDTGVSYPISSKTLSDLGIGIEDWDAFWRSPPDIR
ncbi:MAG: hypothetical protein ACOC58_00990 [Chloroflexota bacterium]